MYVHVLCNDVNHSMHVYIQEYKPPCSQDIPVDFRVELLKNAPNPVGVLGSKCECCLGLINLCTFQRGSVCVWGGGGRVVIISCFLTAKGHSKLSTFPQAPNAFIMLIILTYCIYP